MQTRNRMLDDLARVAGGALGAAAGVRSEVEARLREQFERILDQMDLVTREEFDAVQAMVIKAREENEALSGRLKELDSRLARLEKGGSERSAARRRSKTGTASKKDGKSASPRRAKGTSR